MTGTRYEDPAGPNLGKTDLPFVESLWKPEDVGFGVNYKRFGQQLLGNKPKNSKSTENEIIYLGAA
jgi:hypothetical protein